jgi:hypothetical protein
MTNSTATTATTTTTTAPVMGTPHAYDSQLPMPEIAGQRDITCCYKQTAKMKADGLEARANVYYSVPTEHLTEDIILANWDSAAPYVLAYLRSVEDEAVRKYHKEGGQDLYLSSYSLERVLGILEENGNGGSIDSAQITTWFTEHLSEKLTDMLIAKMPDPENVTEGQATKISGVVAGYLAQFISLASGKTQLILSQRERLINAMTTTESAHTVMGQRFMKRFQKQDAKEAEALAALGDLDI